MLQRYRCPNCQVPVSYGQQLCDSCGVSINWQGVSPSAPFGAKDLSTGFGAPVSDLQPVPGSETSDLWKQELQEKSRLWHKKLAYDPTYNPVAMAQSRERTMYRGALVVLLILLVLLAVFVVLGIATHGAYFNIFSASNSSAPDSPLTPGSTSSQAAVPGSPATSSSLPGIDTQSAGSQVNGNPVETQKPDEPNPAEVSWDKPVISIAELEQQIHGLINRERVSNGLQPLNWDIKLNTIARAHSSDMALRDYFNHITPEGYTVADRYRRGGYTIAVGCGENIFMCPVAKADYYRNGLLVKTDYYQQSEIADVIVKGWMNSPGHRQNILSANWMVQSIGIAISSDDKVYVTEDFA